MALCTTCKNFDLANFSKSPDGIQSNSVAALEESAKGGCTFCSFIYNNAVEHIRQISKHRQVETDDYWIRLSLSGNGTSPHCPQYNKLLMTVSPLRFLPGEDEIGREASFYSDLEHEICIAADPGGPAYQSGLVGGRYLGQNRTSPGYLAALKVWFEDCIASHPDCCRTISDKTTFNPHAVDLPTRCIEVTSSASYLRETVGMTGSYVTLSHRWNLAGEDCKTTTSNYEARISGEDLNISSKNFEGAIAIVRGLGLRYIWIDSICIIQGSDDWDQEKWKMGRYYQCSLFTIAAISSNGQQNDGFLQMSQTDPIRSIVRLPYREDGFRKGNFYVYRRDRCAEVQFWGDVDRSELLSRGWVFQEWLLSRRIVYFTANETFTECNSRKPNSLCNDLINTSKERYHHGRSSFRYNHGQDSLNNGFKVNFDAQENSVFATWYAVVRAFSTTQLTRRQDRLAAISGAAGEYGAIVGQQLGKGKSKQQCPSYLSGLWLQDIHHGLLWHAKRVMTAAYECKAPTWSWLSSEGLVGWPSRGKSIQPVLEIINAVCEPARKNMPEAVIMTLQLVVRTKMQPVLIKRGVDDQRLMSQATGTEFKWDKATRERNDGKFDRFISPERLHTVCHPSSPDVAGGWATFERASIVEDLARTEAGIVGFAVVVATKKNFGGNQFIPDLFKIGSDVYDVLFVEPAGNGVFKRVGIGMIVDWKILEEFRGDMFVEISLE